MPVCLGSKISLDVYKLCGPLEAFTRAPSVIQQQPTFRSGTFARLPKLSLPLMSVGSPQSSMQKRVLFTRCDHRTPPPLLSPYILIGRLQVCYEHKILCRSAGNASEPSSGVTSQAQDRATDDPETGGAEAPAKVIGDSNLLFDLSSGQLYLMAVAALWGSYAPALR